jgi:hypothetical protein
MHHQITLNQNCNAGIEILLFYSTKGKRGASDANASQIIG